MSTLIKNGKIIDGISDEAFEGNILIENGKISKIIRSDSMDEKKNRCKE